MNHKKGIFVAALLVNGVTATAQTTVFLTQENSKSSGYQVILLTAEGKQIPVATAVYTVDNFSEGLASIQTMDKKYGFINEEGKMVIPASFSNVGNFKNGLAWAKDASGKFGFIDESGSWAILPELDAVKSFDEVSGMARVKKGDVWYYVNKTGEPLMVDSDHFWDFSEGLCQGEKQGLRGFFDNKGEWVIEAKFDDAKKFENGQALVKQNGKWGIINTKGDWLLEPKFDVIKEFERTE